MRSFALFAVVAAFIPGLAMAAPVKVAGDAPFAVAVETLVLGKADKKPGMLWDGFTAGGYVFVDKLTSTGKGGGFMLNKMKYTVTVEYRFAKADTAPIHAGKCQIGSETKEKVAGLIAKTTSDGLYACAVDDVTAKDYGLEVAVPPLNQTSLGDFSADKDRGPDKFKNIIARMIYKGVTYEAVPTSFDASRMISRIVDGYLITRDGKPVGRVDFDGNTRNKGKITAPVAEADGREAVIFMASQLVVMPELNAGYMRGMVQGN